MKKEAKSMGWFIVAFLTCPCHLVLILPLLAGTALGAYVADYQIATIVILTIIFAVSLYNGWKRMNQTKS
jgi:mercuric ion transport protein